MSRTGAQLLVDALVAHGVDTAFCVPGESYLAVLDALRDAPIRLVVCRQEGGSANMADAYGKLTGRPGVCFVTRGPGATNASVGIHTAFHDSTPVVLFVGQVSRGHTEREAFQEVDVRRLFGQLSKWAAQVEDPARVPELVARAFGLAVSGRPGPVVLALPEDMLVEAADAVDAPRYERVQPRPGTEDAVRLRELLAAARRPLLLAGGGAWTPRGTEDLGAFAAAWNLPAATTFRRQDLLDNTSPQYAGDVGIGINPALAQRVRDADLLLAVGTRLADATTGSYTLVEPPVPRQRLVHVYPDPDELGRVYAPELAIVSAPAAFAAVARALEPAPGPWAEWTRAARADYERWLEPDPVAGALDLGRAVRWLCERLPDAIVTNGAGNFSGWAHRFHQFRRYPSQLAPTSGAMGYGLPAAVAAKLVHPERPVVCFAGDGDFLMTGQELATAVQYELPLVVLLVNNGMYGTIRMHQEREYPGRVVATELRNPDFAAYARAFGAHGAVVERTEEFADAFEEALAAERPAVLELRIDPEQITHRTTLAAIRERALRSG